MASSNEIIQIEQIDKQLNSLNSSITNTATNYLKLVKTIAENNVVIKEQATTFESVAKAQKQTQESSKQLDELDKKLAATEAALKQLEDGRMETLIKNRIEIQKTTKEITNKVKAEQAEAGSLAAMRVKLSELTAAYDKSGTRTKAAAEEINKLSREIGKAEAATNRHQRGVGGYADQLGKLKNKFSEIPGPIGNAGVAMSGFITNISALGPIGAMIGASYLAIAGPLVAFFTKTEKGVEMLERKTAGFKAAWNVLVGDLAHGGEIVAKQFEQTAEKSVGFWTKMMSGISPAFLSLGVRMDMASDSAEKYTKIQQDLEDAERKLIVPRSEANLQIKKAMELYNDSSNSIQVRMKGLKDVLDLEEKTAQSEMDHQKQVVENIKVINLEKQKAGQLRDEDDKRLQEAIAKQIDLETESVGRTLRANKRLDSARKEISDVQKKEAKERQDAIDAENKKKADAIDKDKENNSKILDDFRTLQAQKRVIAEAALKNIGNLETDKLKKYAEDKQAEADIDQKAADEKEEIARNTAEKIRDIQFQMASDAVNGIFDLGSAKRDEELSALDKERQAKLSNEKLTAAQKEKINAEYDKKAAAIKTKQAKSDKLQAEFNIALNTAMGAMKAVAEFPLTGGMPFLAWVLAAGALQMALVAAQPIPKFKDGTNSAPGKGIFGEAGRELMFLRDNSVMMADKPTYFEGNKFKGAKIFSNPETERMMGLTEHSVGGRMMTDDRILQGLNKVEKAILSKPVAIYDRDYKPIGQAYSSHQEIYLNKLTRSN